MANKTILFNLDIETSGYVKKVKDAEINVANLKNKQQELYDQLTKIGDKFGYNSKQYAQAIDKIKEYDAAIKVASKDVQNANKQLEDQVRYNNAAAGSYEQLYRQWKNAEIALKTQAGNMRQLADGTFQLTEQGKKAAAEVLRLKEGVLKFNAEIKDGRLNVGNYAQSIGDYFSKVQQATGGTSAFSQALGSIGDAVTQTSSAISLLKTGTTAISGAITNAADGLSNFFSVSSEGGNSFTTFNDNAEEAVDNLGGLSEGGEEAGKVLKTTTNSGILGMKGLGKAILATGIGALLLLIGQLVGYMSTLQSVTDKVKIAFAGIEAVFKVYLKTVFDVVKAIATLDFSAAFDAFKGFAGNAKNAATAAAGLEQKKIDLQNLDINNLKILDEQNDIAEKNRIISQDRTRSEEERIAAFEKAIDAEINALKIQQKREQQAYEIAKAEVDLANETGEASREQIQAMIEAEIKLGDVQDALNNKEIQRVQESSKIRRQLMNDRIQSEIGMLNNQLKMAELSGRETFAVQREIARKEMEAQKSDTTKNKEEVALIEDNYRVKLAEIDNAAAEARRSRQNELAQLRLKDVFDAQSRELQAVALATEANLRQVVKGTKEANELRKRIQQEGFEESLMIAQKYAQQTQEEQNKIFNSNVQIQQNEIDSEAAKQQELIKLQLSAMSMKQILTEEDIRQKQALEEQALIAEENRLKKQLDLQLNATAQRIAADDAYYDSLEQKVLNSGLNQEQIKIQLAEIEKQRREQELTTEQEQGAKIQAITDAINNNRVEKTISANNTIVENNKRLIEEQKALQEAVTDAVLSGFSAITDVLKLNEKNQKQFAVLMKSIALAELGINLQREISGYWAGVARDTATGGFVLGTASSAKATAQTIAASLRAAAGIAKITAQKFETGGFTVQDAIQKYNPSISNNFSGGFVSSPTMWAGKGNMNLAGENGTEWVSPNWQIKQAPQIFSALESWRRTGVKPFADGGFTTSTITQPLQQNAELLENAIARAFMSVPPPVVSVQEINDTQQRIATIESRATL